MSLKRYAVIAIASATLSACTNRANPELESLKKDVQEIKTKLAFEELLKGASDVAYLTPGDAGYSPVKFELGYLTVQLADVKPYANGSKVTLKFGNPLAATINGLKFKVDWGKVKDGTPQNDAQKTKDVVLAQPIFSGRWTSVQIVLDSLPPSELGFVRAHDVEHTGIQLGGG